MTDTQPKEMIRISGLVNRFGDHLVHDGIDLSVYEHEVLGIVGGSGTGKSVLLNCMLGLRIPTAGEVRLFGKNICQDEDGKLSFCQSRWGVLFQTGALFSGLTVLENVMTPIQEHSNASQQLIKEIACLKLRMVGLKQEAFDKYPSELSGGMIKRAALARALAMEPKIIFLDEPTAGLDPISAAEFDALILYLRAHLNLTVVMISHDMDSLLTICDRFAVIVDKKAISGKRDDIIKHPHPWIQQYFGGVRGRAALASA
ncbi:ATP-binding cassette domain-containing protein [Dasania sp. GY-MA-18]|uniref:ATP-binding cassette domain-containing protein n=1 Tax=Dasania phycosphaerae TaxID=2950436 RepID=A0A9J6RHI1_9GAMM|nr:MULTISPECIES: ATP-binding cassette domain-containing protein [Dasania]MCR8921300.1 ATP-binding cassette domain-containing protein [Dasania sp. GY-MA-18]MCZ0863728.1 ATP-binding cassette domain-containing protein [Dasania phycosphaerae]MCZ0867456.1 ATP-binding cassette domain-containing protein [Dasania phycosphaerae]